MPALYSELRSELLGYKNAGPTQRQQVLDAVKASIAALSVKAITNKHDLIEACETMGRAATIINYANTLRRIDTQQFFDILPDFKMGVTFEKEEFAELKQYFEFHQTAPQMRLLKSRADIPLRIWELFREAQIAHIAGTDKAAKFLLNNDELDLATLPIDQLYPLPIQMFGKYDNEAVDRIYADSQGRFSLAHNYGKYLLPGGGMIEIDLESTTATKTEKVLIEFLEELHGNLWKKAAAHYNEIKPRVFVGIMTDWLAKQKDIETILGHKYLRGNLSGMLRLEHRSNAELLSDMIALIQIVTVNPNMPDQEKQRKLIRELRATIQVEPFKSTKLYQDTLAAIRRNSVMVDIEQFGDERVCGGKQMSHVCMMTGESLEERFATAFNSAALLPGDDLTGATLKKLTLLEMFANFANVKFSHILIALHFQKVVLAPFGAVWQDQFKTAIDALRQGVESAMTLEGEAAKARRKALESSIKDLHAEYTKASPTDKPLIRAVYHAIAELYKANEDVDTLIVAAARTVTMLKGGSLDDYLDYAKTIKHGQSSKRWLSLSGIMLALGAGAGAVGLVVATPIGAVVAASAAAFSAYGFFSGRQSGLSKAACNLGAARAKQLVNAIVEGEMTKSANTDEDHEETAEKKGASSKLPLGTSPAANVGAFDEDADESEYGSSDDDSIDNDPLYTLRV